MGKMRIEPDFSTRSGWICSGKVVLARLWGNGVVLLVLCNLFWAGSIVMGRGAAGLIPPALFTAVRWGGALALMLPFAWGGLGRDWPVLRARWRMVVVFGVLGIVAYNSLVYRGLHDTTAVNALLLQSATPLLTLVAALLLFGERPSGRSVAAIVVSIAGVVVIAAQGSWAELLQLRVNPGDGLVLMAVAAYAAYGVLLRLRPAVAPLSLLAAAVAVGVVILVPLAWGEFAAGARLVVTPFSVLSLVYAAVLPAFVSYLFYNRGVELVGAAWAGQSMHLMPAFGIVLAVVFLGERLHPFHAVGMGLIGAGLWMAGRRR